MGFSLFGHYIPAVGLSNLHRYKYSSGGYTPLDRMMTPFWEWVALRIPVYVHPNVLTLVGVIGAVCGAVLQLGHTPYLSEAAPSWVYFSVAFFIFLQQTCDAVDGKHARRNGVSSPLGQLFDHGGDIMLATPLALASMAFVTAGTGLVPHIIAMASSQLFQFIYVWWELHFHVFYAATGAIGVTEAQWGLIIMALVSGLFGPWVWHYNLLKLLPSSRVKETLSTLAAALGTEVNGTLLVQVILVACNLWALVYNIAVGIRRSRKPALAASHVLCFLSYMCLQATLWHFCLNGLPETRLPPLLLYFTITTSYSIFLLRLCLSATCRFPFRLFHWPLVPFVLAAAAFLTCSWCQQRRHTIFLGVCAWNVLYLADFLHTNVSDVCNSLDISCFRVNMKKVSRGPREQQMLQEQEKGAGEEGTEMEQQREQRAQRKRGSGGRQPQRQRHAYADADAATEEENMQMRSQQQEEALERVAARPRATRASKTKAVKAVDVNGENDVVSHYEAERRKGA